MTVASVAIESGVSPAELLHTPGLLAAVMMALQIKQQHQKMQQN